MENSIEINIGIDHVDKIYHIADVHVRNVKRHKEYREVFSRLYTYIKKTRTDNSLIYVAGDIVHAKTDMSPELIDLVQEFLRNLSDICPTIVIAGNHDCNLNNSYRLDAISPIISAMNHKRLWYLKDNGIYHLGGIHFNVMSVFNSAADYIPASEFEGAYKIALHHGAVDKASTDLGITLSNTHVTTETFKGHDLVLLGDIHKRQFLNEANTIGYPGSIIQQNHSEVLGHGIFVWDIKTSSAEYVEILNDYGYYTFEIDRGTILNPSNSIPKKPRVRLKIKDTDSGTLKTLVAQIRQQYEVQEIAIQKVSQLNEKGQMKKFNIKNIRDVEFQNKLITEYLTATHALDDVTLDTVRHINRTVHSKTQDLLNTRNITWVPKRFEFSNMFSYGEGNVLDFTDLTGLYGLFAPNASGKSTLLDALSFCLFDTCSRTNKALHVLNNKKNSFYAKFQFEVDGKDYFIERVGTKNHKGRVKVLVDFWSEDAGVKESLNGDQRDTTNKNIRQYLGTFDDFILTTLSIQGNNSGFIEKSQTERKDLLSQFLDIDIFDKLYQMANDDIKETVSIIKEYKKRDYALELATAEIDILSLSGSYDIHTKEKQSHEEMRGNLSDIIETFAKDIKPIDNSITRSEVQINTELKGLQTKLDTVEKEITVISQSIETNNSQFESYQLQLNSISEDGLKEECKQFKLLIEDKKTVSEKKHTATLKLEQAEAMSLRLRDHQYDPECEYCSANPFVRDAIQSHNSIPTLQKDLSELQQLYNTIDNRINDSTIEARTTSYSLLKQKTATAEFNLMKDKVSLNEKLNAQKLYTDKINTCNNELGILQQYKTNIEHNININTQISELKSEIADINLEIGSIDKKIVKVSGQLQVAIKTRKDILAAINKLKDLENQHKAYEYYLEAVKRDGVPYDIITKALPELEAEINNILNQVVGFTVLFDTDDKNINGYIVYDDTNFWPMELTSGMEKFITSLAIRTALLNISNLPRPNFIVIDEGFGSLDSDNLTNMNMLFDYLKTQFNSILCISHIDSMRDVMDKLIEIKRENGYSKIEFN
jgi:DNA repair exonuclease SbcCD ATPase subunit/DNA repair exonuclease SbcCD nuclease subunit